MTHSLLDPAGADRARVPWAYKAFVVVALLGAVLGLVLCCGCVSPERTASNTVADVANVALPVLVAGWTQQALKCVATSTTRPAADACISDVDNTWKPVWLGYKALRLAHDVFRTALNTGKVPDLASLMAPYCALRAAATTLYALPDWPIGGCQGSAVAPVAGQTKTNDSTSAPSKAASQPIAPVAAPAAPAAAPSAAAPAAPKPR